MAPWYLFVSTIKEVDNTNVALKYLLLEVTSKKLSEKKVLFNFFDRS